MSASPKGRDGKPPALDPVFVHARRELLVIICLFAIFCIWSLCVCYGSGYASADDNLEAVPTTFGMPRWAFWGLLVPWLAVDVVALWFCFFFMKDDDLGEAHEGEDLQEQVAHMHEHEEKDHG